MDSVAHNDKIMTIKSWLGTGSINIFGLPFAGKDTQSKKLARLLDAQVVGSGNILRSHSDQDTIKRLMSTGELFPSEYYLEIVVPFLSKPEFANKPLVMSSVGRRPGEEKVTLQAAMEAKHPIKAVVFLSLSEKEVRDRFKSSLMQKDRGQRRDDAENLIDTRLKEFNQKTEHVIEFYRSIGLLVEVDGSGTQEAVARRVEEALLKFSA